MLDAGNGIAVSRRAAGRDQDMACAHALAVRQLHIVRVGDDGAVFDDGDAGFFQRHRVGGFEPADFLVFVGNERRPVERRLRHRPAIAGGVLEFAAKARRIDEKLLRHAAANDAGAADAIFLREHHPRAMLRGDARGAHAARATAYDKKIDVVIGHARLCRGTPLRVFRSGPLDKAAPHSRRRE